MLHSILNGADLHAPTNYLVENNTGSTITALKVVTIIGIGTNFPSIRTVTSPVDPVRGVVMADILTGESGYVTGLGFLINIDTAAWPVDTKLYADTSGNLTTTPTGPLVATVYKQDATVGQIYVENVSQASGGGGGGDVFGPASSTDRAIVVWDGTTGKLIQDGPGTMVQSSGAVEVQAIIVNRSITGNVEIPSDFSMIASNIEIEGGSITIESDGELIIL